MEASSTCFRSLSISKYHQLPVDKFLPLQGSGEDYMGTASRTKTGKPCAKWDSPEIK